MKEIFILPCAQKRVYLSLHFVIYLNVSVPINTVFVLLYMSFSGIQRFEVWINSSSRL